MREKLRLLALRYLHWRNHRIWRRIQSLETTSWWRVEPAGEVLRGPVADRILQAAGEMRQYVPPSEKPTAKN